MMVIFLDRIATIKDKLFEKLKALLILNKENSTRINHVLKEVELTNTLQELLDLSNEKVFTNFKLRLEMEDNEDKCK